MASHLNTPESVLTAPHKTVSYIVWHNNPNRAMRRHPGKFPALWYRDKNGEYQAYKNLNGVNTPYEK